MQWALLVNEIYVRNMAIVSCLSIDAHQTERFMIQKPIPHPHRNEPRTPRHRSHSSQFITNLHEQLPLAEQNTRQTNHLLPNLKSSRLQLHDSVMHQNMSIHEM